MKTPKTTKTTNWKKAYDKMCEIAGDALGLADAYAGGESDNAKSLTKQYERLRLRVEKD